MLLVLYAKCCILLLTSMYASTQTRIRKPLHPSKPPKGYRAKKAKRKPRRHTAHPVTARGRSTAADHNAGARPAGTTM